MENMKAILKEIVSQRLAAVPDGAAKAEVIEELTENLCFRYEDMLAAGMEPEEARERTVDELGDTDELVEYLKGLEPDQPLPESVHDAGKPDDSQLEELFHNVEDIIKGALSHAKNVFREAKDNLTERDSARSAKEEREDSGEKMGFTFELDTEKGEFVMGGTPREEKPERDVIYGVGYDKAKGGFFAQWGEYKGGYNRPVEGPVSSEALRGISVHVCSGDVTIRMTEDAEADVLVDGDVEELDIRRSDDGVLTIEQGKTASSSFFFGRGLSCADVILYLPRRKWDFLKVDTVSGDVIIEGDHEVDLVAVRTTSGDLEGGLPHCRQLAFKAVSGDMDWRGDADKLQCVTTSGDISVMGAMGEVHLNSVSGDIRLEGTAGSLRCATSSGDVKVHSAVLPAELDLAARSGDSEIWLPDGGSFDFHFRTGTGELCSDFFCGDMDGKECTFRYGQEGGPVYHAVTTSGDLRLKKI